MENIENAVGNISVAYYQRRLNRLSNLGDLQNDIDRKLSGDHGRKAQADFHFYVKEKILEAQDLPHSRGNRELKHCVGNFYWLDLSKLFLHKILYGLSFHDYEDRFGISRTSQMRLHPWMLHKV